MPCRVVHLIASGQQLAGAEHVVLAGAGAQACSSVISLRTAPGADGCFVAAARARGVDVQSLSCTMRIDVLAALSLRTWLSRHDVDIVHTHGLRALAVGLMASTHAAVVCTLHGFTEHDGHARRLAEVERRMARWASHTAAVSRPLAEDLLRRGHPGHRLCVVKNPVRLSPQGPRKAFQRGEPLRLIALSRLSPEKGLDIGIRAIAAQPAAELDIWGAGPQHDELSSLILALGVGARVRLRGQTDNVAGVLQGAHGLLLPSRREGEPLSLLEALASGLPVVASAVGGIPDAVEGTGAGRLVPPDDVDALADAIALLAEHHAEHARAAAAAAPRLMADRSPAAWAVRMDDVYRGALQERCTARRGFRATRPA